MRSENNPKNTKNTEEVSNDTKKPFFIDRGVVINCRNKLKKYFHPKDSQLAYRFKIIYQIFELSDETLASKVGIDGSTMCRYRNGIFIPSSEMKLRIAQKIGVDSSIIWGDSLFFERWKNNLKEEDKNEN